jgi:CRP/FNR family cyclic AMP-dependent transcriptional regulator
VSLYRWVKVFFANNQHWDDMAFFRAVSIFQGLTSRQLGRIMQAMQKRTYHAGEILFSEGQIGKAVFIIRSGEVELTRSLKDGRTRSLGKLGEGQIFGEMALLENMPRTAGATVTQDGEIFLLYTSTLEALILRIPAIGVIIMRNMAIMLSALLRRTNQELDSRASKA